MEKKPLVNFVEKKPLNVAGYTLIEGFPGMGLVGTIAVKYLSEKLDCKEAGYIVSETFVPIIRVHNGLTIHPSRIGNFRTRHGHLRCGNVDCGNGYHGEI